METETPTRLTLWVVWAKYRTDGQWSAVEIFPYEPSADEMVAVSRGYGGYGPGAVELQLKRHSTLSDMSMMLFGPAS